MCYAERFRYNATRCYFAFIFTGLPLFFVDMYFNISQEKWLFFILCSIIYIFIMAVSFLFEEDGLTHIKPLFQNWSITEYAVLAFLVFTAVSTVFSKYPMSSLSGEQARYHGLSNVIVYFIVFLFVRRYFYKASGLIRLLSVIGAFVSITAICQYLTWDPIGMYKDVTVQSVHRMISTIGNMNIYASFLSIVLPTTIYLFISADSLRRTFIYGLFLTIGFAGAIAGNSDSVYIGVGAGLAVMIASGGLTASAFKRLPGAIACGSLGAYLILLAAHILRDKGAEIRPVQGFAAFFTEHTDYMLMIFFACTVLCLLLHFLPKPKHSDVPLSDKPLFGRKSRIAAAVILLSAIAAIFICVFIFFPFADEFGSYRGFIWRLSVNDFKNLSLFRKLVGYGPETLLPVYNSMYHDEMIDITGVVYDNVHCEPLEYLVTSGILGFASYMTLVISLLYRLYRKSPADRECCLYLVPVFAYFAQSFVNIAQSATTPLFFLIMALGLGYLQPDKVKRLYTPDEFTAEDLLADEAAAKNQPKRR